MSFKVIKSDAINRALKSVSRQYLVGDLKRPQSVEAITSKDIEIGVSVYKDFSWESAHYHTSATEFHFITKGMTEYRDLDTNEVHRFSMGDFYVITPMTKYIQRVKQGTEIHFIKSPAGNDKVDAGPTAFDLEWAKQRLRVERLDFHGSDAPDANSMIPAVAAAVISDRNEVLLVRRRDSGNWSMPGGTMELTDSMSGCIKREVLEETGLKIDLKGMIGTYTDPSNIIAYSDGEVRREFSCLFHATAVSGELSLDDESTDVKWVPIQSVSEMKMARSQRRRMDDVVQYLRDKKLRIR